MNNLKKTIEESREEFKDRYGNALGWVEMHHSKETISGIPLWNMRGQMIEGLKSHEKQILKAVLEMVEEIGNVYDKGFDEYSGFETAKQEIKNEINKLINKG